MDYYQSDRPSADESNLSGGVSFNYGGKVAVQSVQKSFVGSSYAENPGGGGGGNMQIYTILICVDGVQKSLDVYAAGPPY
jgi:hypothetical protein